MASNEESGQYLKETTIYIVLVLNLFRYSNPSQAEHLHNGVSFWNVLITVYPKWCSSQTEKMAYCNLIL